MAVEIVTDHLPRTRKQTEKGAGKTAVAHAPHLERREQRVLDRETAGLGTLSACGTVIATEFGMTVGTNHWAGIENDVRNEYGPKGNGIGVSNCKNRIF